MSLGFKRLKKRKRVTAHSVLYGENHAGRLDLKTWNGSMVCTGNFDDGWGRSEFLRWPHCMRFGFLPPLFSLLQPALQKLNYFPVILFVEDRRCVLHNTGCYLPEKLHFHGKEIVHLWSATVWKHLLLEEASCVWGIINSSFYKPSL